MSLIHANAVSRPNWNPIKVNAFEAGDIHAKMIGGDAFAMEWINPAGLAEEMAGGIGMELVLRKRFFTLEEFEVILMHFHHECISAPAD